MRMKLHQVADGFANRVVADFGEWFGPYQQKYQSEAAASGSTKVATQVTTKTQTAATETVAPLIETVTLPEIRSAIGLN